MKKISNICGFIGIAIYAVLMIRISNLCQYGGTKVDLIPILIFGVVLIATIIFGIVSSRKEEKIEKGKLFWGKCIVVVALTILFGGRIIYSAIPYNGALSWKIDEWRNQKKIELTHTNFFETGVEGILEDIETELDLPDELYVQNKFQLSFDKDGEIQSIYTYMYGRYENGDENTFLIDYDVDADSKMTVCINGVSSKSYDDGMRLQPMLEILKNADYKTRVNNWAVEGYADDYEILYYGKREFNTMEGFVYLQGDVDGDGVDNTDNAIYSELNGGAIYGYEVSLHIPSESEVTPVRYFMEPEVIPLETIIDREEEQTIDDAKETESWYVDNSNGSVYYWLSENKEIGWRLVVTDAAAGSRYYELEKSSDGGETWNVINANPFNNKIGVALGIEFYDENLGVIGMTGVSQDASTLYVTSDGGVTFTQMEFPMEEVTELPDIADELGYTIADYDYAEMPQVSDGQWTVIIKAEYSSYEGLRFTSNDNGKTWMYEGLSTSEGDLQ